MNGQKLILLIVIAAMLALPTSASAAYRFAGWASPAMS
jgi:hypothetical protein